MRLRRPLIAAGLTASLLWLVGCSRDDTAQKVGAMNKTNIQRLANVYAAHQNFRSGQGPKDEAEFKKFITEARELDDHKQQMMGIDKSKVDQLFTSERDGKPFKIRYKVGGGRGSVDAVIFEVEGKDGKKEVAYTGGKVDEVDDATYQQLLAGKGPGQPAAAPQGTVAGKGGRPSGPPPGAPKGPPGK